MTTPYTTYKGKQYLKSVMIAQANKVIAEKEETNIHLVLPPGVVFRATSVAEPYVVVDALPFKGRFMAKRVDGIGPALHALATLVERVEDLPDKCPPVVAWDRIVCIDGQVYEEGEVPEPTPEPDPQ